MDREFDAIVVGAGAAGLVAALRAASGGARVALIERDASTPCNLAISGGLVAAAGTRWQAEAGVADDPARFAADLRAKAGEGIIDPVLLDTVTRRAAEALHFLADTVGLPLHLHTASAWPGQSAPRLHATPAESGAELCALLREAARAHPRIAWRDGTEVVGLVVDSDGAAVRGVEVSAAGRRSTLAAPHVVLACGGFGGAPAMLARFIPEAVGALHIGSPLSDGRAILWAEALGAALDCMDAYQGQPHVCLGGKARLGAALPALGAILVNRAGERFAREDMGPSELTAHILAQPGGMAVEIWHEAAHRAKNSAMRFPERLPPVRGHQDQPPAAGFLQHGMVEVGAYGIPEHVRDGVACNINRRFRFVFFAQIGGGPGSRRKMKVGNDAGQLPVHFLRIRGQFVPGAQARFHMSHPNLLQKRGIARQERRDRVAVNKDEIRSRFPQHRFQPLDHANRNVRQRLPVPHDVEVVIRNNPEHVQHLVEHLAMLGSHADERFELIRMLFQFQHQRRHFDGFRADPKNGHHFQFAQVRCPPFLPSIFQKIGRAVV